MPTSTYWDRYNTEATLGPKAKHSEHTFAWSQHPGHGPGLELLGDPKTALDLGSGWGFETALLAKRGIRATGLDGSQAAYKQAVQRWGNLENGRFIHADAVTYLTETGETFDAIYSIFGCLWFTDPEILLPLIHQRLNPGGRLVFSHAPAVPGTAGPQGTYTHGLRKKEMYVVRWSYAPEVWERMLTEAGFGDAAAEEIPGPEGDDLGTLIVQATRA